ncbi:MAG: hypothetical protein ACK5MT_06315 [Actinomycetales bacterium]
MSDISAWFEGRLPDEWFTESASITVDRDEILVVGRLAEPTVEGDDTDLPAAEAGRLQRFREDTRSRRMRIADEAEARFGRKVAWGAECGSTRQVFTTLAVPVMTRLRQPERLVLDTLVEAGVARSRSDALAWSVRLVGRHQKEWIEQLRQALVNVEAAREAGPRA